MFILNIPVLISLAEGTKQFRPAETNKGYLCIDPTRNSFFLNGGDADHRLWIHISDFTRESIYFGFGSLYSGSGTSNYYIYRPDGTILSIGSVPTYGLPGYISTWTQAVSGPDVIAPGTGYPSLNCIPDMNGDYYMACQTTPMSSKSWENFDITVINTTTMTAIEGRVWSKAWQIYCDIPSYGSANKFFGKMYVYSPDSIVTKIDFNGIVPGIFTVSCNESGCYPISPGMPASEARRSVSLEHTYPQYKIFLNDPDNAVYPTGTIGRLDDMIPVTTIPHCDGTVDFSFGTTKSGNVDISLQLSSLGPPYSDRILSVPVTAGINTIQWDGLDGSSPATPVVNGAAVPFQLSYVNSLTHFPLYDVEFNQNGFNVSMVRPVTFPSPPDPLFYWDDLNFPMGTANFTGCASLPGAGCHTWMIPPSGGFGDSRTLNTWYSINSATPVMFFTEKRSPQLPGIITGQGTICPGTSGISYSVAPEPNSDSYVWSYTGTGASIHNNGTHSVTVDFDGGATTGNITVHGVNLCGDGPSSSLGLTASGPAGLSGSFYYNNDFGTALDSVKVYLKKNGIKTDSTLANLSGVFSFTGKPCGIYTVSAATRKPWSGVNGTDALKVQRHFTGLELLTVPIRLMAADVNNTNSINATDALKIKRRFAGLDNSFDRGDWVFAKVNGGDTLILAGNDISQDFYGLCTGDVNGSNIPSTGQKAGHGIELISVGSLYTGPGEEFEIPVLAGQNTAFSAASFVLLFPQELIRINEIRMLKGDLIYTVKNGEARMVWAETEPVTVMNGEPVFILHAETTNNFTAGNTIRFSMSPESELADENSDVINGVVFNMPLIRTVSNEGSSPYENSGFNVQVYPNPASGKLYLEFETNGLSTVEVSLLSLYGRPLLQKTINFDGARNLAGELSVAKLRNGVYLLKITESITGRGYTILKKVVINK